MVNMRPTFLTVPERAAKPRTAGLTHVLDKGMPVAELEALLQVCGDYVDVWKFGWGTAYLDPGVPAKLEVLAEHGVLSCTGGTLLEIAWSQGVADSHLTWAGEVGFDCVEVSCGVAAMSADDKRTLIETAAERFIVLAEIGTKDPHIAVDAKTWGQDAAADLAAGARWVVTEGRESGTVGLFDPAGFIRRDVVNAVVDAVGLAGVVFEAPRKDQQAWLVREFGADVSVGNVAPGDTLALEALRLGLRADTFEAVGTRPSLEQDEQVSHA
jgi:phosphosulfolactate synthase